MPTRVQLVKAMDFPVVKYGCESWTIKKADCQRISAFELWCWRRLLGVPWIARRSNQWEISPEYSLEGLMLKLKLQYFGHLMQRTDSLEKTLCWERLKAGGEGDDREWDGWMASLTRWTCIWISSGSWWWTGKPGVLHSIGSQRVRHDWGTELNWTHIYGDNYIYNIQCYKWIKSSYKQAKYYSNYLSYHFKYINRFSTPGPLLLIKSNSWCILFIRNRL